MLTCVHALWDACLPIFLHMFMLAHIGTIVAYFDQLTHDNDKKYARVAWLYTFPVSSACTLCFEYNKFVCTILPTAELKL